MTTEALTWGVAATLAAQEGIKFLFEQLTALLDRAKERRAQDGAVAEPTTSSDASPSEIVAAPPARAFELSPAELRFPVRAVADHEAALQSLLAKVADYLAARERGSQPDECALAAAGELRAFAESLSGCRLTFTGEPREKRPIVQISFAIGRLEGVAVGAEVGRDTTTSFSIEAKVDTVGPGGILRGYQG